jgi:hypothetical protein
MSKKMTTRITLGANLTSRLKEVKHMIEQKMRFCKKAGLGLLAHKREENIVLHNRFEHTTIQE